MNDNLDIKTEAICLALQILLDVKEFAIFTKRGERVVRDIITELCPPQTETEMDKLENYLIKKKIPHLRTKIYDGEQIRCDGWDVVCHSGSYGGNCGLLETMGMEQDNGDVTGWQTAEDIIMRLEE